MEQKYYQILDDDYATYDLCFKVILIGDPEWESPVFL